MSFEEFGFTEAQWDVIVDGPLVMLAHIGGADAYVDTSEWTALIDAVHEDALVAAVTTTLSARLHSGHVPVPDAPAPLAALEEIAAVLDACPVDSTTYRIALMEIGATIADASGARLTIRYAFHHGRADWIPSPATSRAERDALSAAAQALGLAVPAVSADETSATN